jgi:L-ribulose-5-phosphate 4-epimerase
MRSCEGDEYDRLKRDLIEVAKRACDTQLQVGSGGNLSIRVPGKEIFIIKPSGKGFLDLCVENLLVVNLDGEVVSGHGKPSKDTMSHAGIYRFRPDVHGILHVHATWALAFALDECEIPLVTEEAIDKIGAIPVVPCIPGKLSQNHQEVAARFADSTVRVALLAKHGLIGVGETLREAAELCELANESAKLAYLRQLRKAVCAGRGIP